MKDRLLHLIKSEGLTSSLLADELGVQRSGISHILSGRNNPSFDFLQKILGRFPKINAEWLILGKGSMYKATEAKLSELFSNIENTSVIPVITENSNDLSPVEGKKNDSSAQAPKILSLEEPQKIIDKMIIMYKDKTFAIYTQDD